VDIVTRKGAAVSSHPLAARAGADTLRLGGNAVDAAISAALVECVVQPHNTGIGGYGGVMIIHLGREHRSVCVDFDSVAPLACTPDMFEVDPDAPNIGRESGLPAVKGLLNDYGCMSVSVPANVAGFAFALRRYGRMSWAEVSQAAIEIAENGFVVDKAFALALRKFAPEASNDAKEIFFRGGRVPAEGDILAQPDLARLLRRLADEGPEAFYGDEIGGEIVRQVQEGGGLLQMEDLRRYTPTESEPIFIRCGPWEVQTPGLPAGGVTSLQIARAVHEFGPTAQDYRSGRYHHFLIEAMKLAWQERLALAGDPLFVDDPTPRLLSDAHARETVERVRDYVGPDTPVGGLAPDSHTVHTCTADSEGNMVSLTSTQGAHFGSRVAVRGFGFILGHGISRFDPLPGRANSIAPGKRMLHNMSPIALLKDGELRGVFGLPGGRKIVNVAAQMTIGFIQFGMSPSEAIFAPRVHTEGREPVVVERNMPKAIVRYLQSRGHRIQLPSPGMGGPASAIMIDHETGLLKAASQRGPEAVSVL